MKTVELFAGAGGLGIGIGKAGFQPVLVLERDKYCCDTIRHNQARSVSLVKHWPLFEGDVRSFDFTKFRDHVELVSGGPPCQPFSLGGKHRAYNDVRDMFPEAVRAVRETQPKAFIFENVKGLTRASFASYFEYIRLQLTYPEIKPTETEDWPEHLARLERFHTSSADRNLHYNVVTRVLNAADFGIPQRRERVFFVGFRSDLGIEWNFPEPTHSQFALLHQQRTGEYWDRHCVSSRSRVLSERVKSAISSPNLELDAFSNLRPWRTVRDAIGDLPDPERQKRASKEFLNHNFQPGARSYPGHTGSPLDEPAKTLKAGVHGVPGGENMLLRADGSVRYFTVRESARLQTFPDNYEFNGAWSETMRQLGNAVPVELATFIAKDIAKHLDAYNVRH